MTKRALRDPVTGLFPNEEAFARACLRMNQSDAYRSTLKPETARQLSTEQVNERSSRMAAKPAVSARVRALVDEAKISDLDTAGSAYTQLCSLLAKATDAKNWTACAAFMRLKLQVLGMLKEIVMLSPEQGISDDDLIKRVAKDNPGLAIALRNSLGKDEKFAA